MVFAMFVYFLIIMGRMMCLEGYWGNIWAALGALGSLAVAGVSVWLALRRPRERVSGEWEPLPFGVANPTVIAIRLKNHGRNNVDLPDALRVDFYMDDTHWGTSYAEKCDNNFIPAKFYSYSTVVALPDEQLQEVVCDEYMRMFTWTKAGTRIELQRRDTEINLDELGI